MISCPSNNLQSFFFLESKSDFYASKDQVTEWTCVSKYFRSDILALTRGKKENLQIDLFYLHNTVPKYTATLP